jgi:hypothetical protein
VEDDDNDKEERHHLQLSSFEICRKNVTGYILSVTKRPIDRHADSPGRHGINPFRFLK